MVNKYVLKYHHHYYLRVSGLKEQVKALKAKLSNKDYKQHEIVKLAARIRNADQNIIPQDPNLPEYRLKRDLKKYRRYKSGLQRYRIIFCFSSNPLIIIYLYLNDEGHIRKSGSKNDPYEEFKKFVKKGYVSHNPNDPKIQKWIKDKYP